MPDLIITPGSGLIEFVKEGAQSPTVYRLEMAEGAGLVLNAPLTSSVGMKAPNMMDSFGNNIFSGTSTFNGPTVINGNLSVFGTTNLFSASNVYISSSQLTIEDNILTLNAFSPFLRYAGIEMIDSGSGTLSSMLWDGQGDYFFLSGSSVNGKILTGPDNQADLTSNYVPKATAGYKLGNSLIYDNGTNVGIGITTPVYKTEIYSGVKTSAFTGLSISNFNNYDGTANSLVKSQLRFAILENPITTYDASQRTFTILESGNEANNSSSDGFFAISTRLNGAVAEKFRITSAGNVGIGTTSPSYKLHVSGSALFQGTYNNALIWDGGGDDNNYFSQFKPGGTEVGRIGFDGYSSPSVNYTEFRIDTRANGDASLFNRMYINSSGTTYFSNTNVGIGTSSPSAKLHIYSSNQHIEASVSGSMIINSGLYALQIGPLRDRSVTANNYYPGIAFNHLLNYQSGTSYNGAPQAWIGTRLQDTSGSERDYLVFATKPGTGTSGTGNDIPIERMCIDRDGNVGIGTTAPSSLLTIQSNGTQLRLQTQSAPGSFFANIGARYDSTRPFTIEVANNNSTPAEFMGIYADSGGANNRVVFPTGNVGIGTTSPTQKLEVAGYVMAGEGLYRTNIYGSNGGAWIGFGDTGSLNSLGRIGAYGALFNINSLNGDTSFQYNSAEKMRITTGGNLGLGITNPAAYVNANGNWFRPSLDGLYSSIYATTEAVVNLISSGSADGAAVGGVYFTRARAQGDAHFQIAAIKAFQAGTSNTIAGGTLYFYTKNNNGGTAATDPAMVIGPGGNVGIGTTSPNTKLHISGSSNDGTAQLKIDGIGAPNTFNWASTFINADLSSSRNYISIIGQGLSTRNSGYIGFNHSGVAGSTSNFLTFGLYGVDNILNINGNGRVGIGTTNPTQKLDIVGSYAAAGDSSGILKIRGGSTGNDTQLNFGVSADGGYGWIQATDVGLTNNINIILNPIGGNVGIGTTTASTKLHIYENANRVTYISQNDNHTARFEAYGTATAIDTTASNGIFFRINGGDIVKFAADGAVGIGTSTVGAPLHIYRASNPWIRLNGGGSFGYIRFDDGTSNGYLFKNTSSDTTNGALAGAMYTYTDSGKAFQHIHAGSPLFTILSGGNIGIGTTAPSASLHVNSTTAGATLIRADGTNGTLFSVVDDLSDSLMSVNNSAGLPVFEVFADDRIVAGQYGQNDFVIRNNKVGIGTNNPIGELHVTSSTSIPSAVFLGGNVGVGTSSPGYKLDVAGSLGINASASDTNWPFVVSDNSSAGSRYALNKLGSMGFNYADTYAQLQLLGAAGGYLDFSSVAGGDSNARLIYYAGSRLDLTYGFSTTLTLTSTNVGIGTTVPRSGFQINTINGSSGNEYAGLTVSATVSASRGVNIAYDATNDIGVIASVHNGVTWKGLSLNPQGGGVGIGTIAPASTLHVVGVISGSSFTGAGTGLTGTAANLTVGTALNVGNGTLTISTGTGIGIGATTTFTANQSGNSTITLSNTGVTSAVAGTGISVSGATGAVTITNSSPNATHTGDVTGATTLTIANDAVTTAKILNANVTLDKIANISTGTILGNNGAGAAAPLALTAAQVASMLSGQTMNIAGNAATSTIVNGTNGQLLFKDIRAIAPNNIAAGYLQFGFTTWANTLSTTPYADYLHLRSYTDSSGGNDNLVMFRKDVIGMRIWQQSFGSASNYSTYKDVAFTDQIGNGTITIAAGTGISVASNTFTTNQSGNSTVTVTNSGVTSNVAGTGISVSGATGAVTITNSGVTSAVAGTGVGVSAATGAVTFSIGQAVGTGNSPTFAGATLNGQLNVNHSVSTAIVRLWNAGSTVWSLGVGDTAGSYFNISADFGSILINKTNGNIWISGSGINNTVLHSGTTSAPNLSIGGNAATATTATNANAISFTEVELNAPVTVSGTWTTGNGSEWGEPKFGTSFNQFRFADGNGPYVEYNIPANHHSCFISQLQWDTGGYADCHGVQADGDLVFLRRINTRQLVENSNHGNTIQHDGATVTFAGSGLQAFTKIRITNRLGRIHMTGIAFTRQIDDGYEGTGMVHPAQISHQGAGSGLDADLLDGYSSATANTANTIVLRDASGNFSAGTITATLSGTATTATTANALNTSNSYTGVNFTATGFFQTNLGQIKSDTSFALLTTSNGAQSVSVRGILLGTSYDTTPGANEIRTTNNTSLFLNARGTGDIQFQTADSLKMMLLNNGNVGVGVSNPSRKLDVEGIVRTRGASGTGGFEIGAATTGAARWRIEWDSASDSLDFNWVA